MNREEKIHDAILKTVVMILSIILLFCLIAFIASCGVPKQCDNEPIGPYHIEGVNQINLRSNAIIK